MAPTVQTLLDLLRRSAESGTDAGIVSYPLHNTVEARRITYSQLFTECRRRAWLLARQGGFTRGGIVLLHFNDHLDNIIWFWTVLVAGCIPALSSPLPHDLDQRRQHLGHLNKLFDAPLCLTRQSTVSDFAICPNLSLLAIEDMKAQAQAQAQADHQNQIDTLPIPTPQPSHLAALMLTSGSTGNAKAVELTHQQILASIAGKDSVTRLAHERQPSVSLLNWIGLDHVAALTETHLLALYRNLEQIHVQAPDIVSDPLLLLRMVTTHRVARTVAPNFLLAALLKSVEEQQCEEENELKGMIDLSTLTQFVSGGEANPVQLCIKVDEVLQRFGAPRGVLQPAFGMTETCAGCTYNTECPTEGVGSGMDFASLGRGVGGFEVRVVGAREEDDEPAEELGRRGILQIRGPMVFSRYYNNPTATAEAFTEDGWFDTGDEAIIDCAGRLHLVGRIKDQIRINGVSIVASDLESQLNGLSLSGAQDGFFAAFGYRPDPTSDESLAILYLPTWTEDDIQRQATNGAIVKSVMRSHGIAPYVLPVDETILQKSTLGKFSRGKLRRALEQGKLSSYEQVTAAKTSSVAVEPRNELEARLLGIFREALEHSLDISMLDMVTPWFNLGITSIQLIRLKRKMELGLGLAEVPLVKLLKCSTIEELAIELQSRRRRDSVTDVEVDVEEDGSSTAYDPVVKLRTAGSKAPLWLFHPGVGEVLVFINMAQGVTDRAVFALRARGFNGGEAFFSSIAEAVDTYYRAIKQQQPHGPYALAGYSYGAMLAFETAKRLNHDGNGDQVAFLASFNLPPHIKFRMRQLDWRACALHLAHFLGLLHDADLDDNAGGTGAADDALTVQGIFDHAPRQRLGELSLTPANFQHWAHLAHEMQSMARDYEPSGRVSHMDVFYCHPLAVVAQSKQEWLDQHLSGWNDFALDVRWHEVGGEHYTMIDTDHVPGFMKTFTDALAARGV